jgi:small GTP-binding protein
MVGSDTFSLLFPWVVAFFFFFNFHRSELPREIGLLTTLTRLDVSGNMLTMLPPQLGLCTSLGTLLCSLNQLRTLPPTIDRMTRLELLSANGNELHFLPTAIGGLVSLQRLELNDNLLVSLPAELGSLPALNESTIEIANNRLVSPPASAIRSGNWLQVLRDQQQAAASNYRVKLMLVGKENVGKTSVRDCIARRKKRGPNLSTDGVDLETVVLPINIGGTTRNLTFNVWDFAGQEIYYMSHQLFLSERALYLVVWDVRNDFDSPANNVGFWLSSIAARAGRDVPIVIVATHIDHPQCTDEYVNAKMLRLSSTYGPLYPNIKSYRAVSTTKGDGIDSLLANVTQVALSIPGVGASVPASYLALDEVMSQTMLTTSGADTARRVPALHWDEWTALAVKCSIADDELLRRATRFLHGVGSIVYFESDNKLGDLVIVEPQWLTRCMATILTTKHRAVRPDGVLTNQMLQHLWRAPDFPPELHPHLRALMERFELMHPLRSMQASIDAIFEAQQGGGMALHETSLPRAVADDYLVVSQLPEARPSVVDEMFPPSSRSSSRLFTRLFSFSFLPAGLFSRFLIRCADLVTLRAYWRYGFAAVRGRVRLLVELVGDAVRVRVSSDGPSDGGGGGGGGELHREAGAAELLREAGAVLEAFVGAWFKVPYKVEVECAHCLEVNDPLPFLFPLVHCESVAAGGKSHVLCRGRTPVRLDRLVPDVAMSDVTSARIGANDLVLGERLGQGSFGEIFVATFMGRAVAVKQMLEQADPSKATAAFADFRQEVWCMAGLDHPNIVNMVGYQLQPPTIVLDLVRGGDLYKFLHTPTLASTLDWPLIIKMAYEIALGMRYLHSATPPILHGDLKSPNILLSGYSVHEPTLCKISDFGLAKRMYAGRLQEDVRTRAVSNPTWLAPEIMREQPFSAQSDVYSYGIILWELLTMKHPFAEFDFKFLSQLEDHVKAGGRMSIPTHTPASFAALISSCWSDRGDQRPLFSSVCQLLRETVAPQLAPSLVLFDFESGVVGDDEMTLANGFPSVTGELVRQLVPSPEVVVLGATCVPHARQVWGGCADGQIVVWSADNGTELGRFRGDMLGARVTSLRVIDGAVWCGTSSGVITVLRAHLKVDDSLLRRSGMVAKLSQTGRQLTRFCVLDVNRLVIYKDANSTDADGSKVLPLANATMELYADVLSFAVKPLNEEVYAVQCTSRADFEIWTSMVRDAINAASNALAQCLHTIRWPQVRQTVRYLVMTVDPALARGRAAPAPAIPSRLPLPAASKQPQQHQQHQQQFSTKALVQRLVNINEVRYDNAITRFMRVGDEVWATGADALIRVISLSTHTLSDSYWLDVSQVADGAQAQISAHFAHRGMVWISIHSVIVRVDVRTKLVVDYLVGHKAPVVDMRMTGSEVWSCGMDQSVRVWWVLSGECMRRIDFTTPLLRMLSVGDSIWIAQEKNIEVWDTTKYVRSKRLSVNRKDTRCMLLVSNKSVWTVHDDRASTQVRVWH